MRLLILFPDFHEPLGTVDQSSLLGLFCVPHCPLWGAGWRASGAHSFPPAAVSSVRRSSLNTCPLFYLYSQIACICVRFKGSHRNWELLGGKLQQSTFCDICTQYFFRIYVHVYILTCLCLVAPKEDPQVRMTSDLLLRVVTLV